MPGKNLFKKLLYDPDAGQASETGQQAANIPRLDLGSMGAPTASSGKVDLELFKQVTEAVKGVNTSAGFQQFIQMYLAMRNTVPDAANRFKIAFETCAAMHGLTVAQLKTALVDQRRALDDETQEFLQTIQADAVNIRSANQEKIAALKKSAQVTNQQMVELKQRYEAELKQLQETLQQQSTEQQQAQDELNSIDQRIDESKSNFALASQAVLQGYEPEGWIGIDKLEKLAAQLGS